MIARHTAPTLMPVPSGSQRRRRPSVCSLAACYHNESDSPRDPPSTHRSVLVMSVGSGGPKVHCAARGHCLTPTFGCPSLPPPIRAARAVFGDAIPVLCPHPHPAWGDTLPLLEGSM